MSLTPRHAWHKLEGFNSSQQAVPLPKKHRAPELSWLLGAGVGKHVKAITGPSAGCALMPLAVAQAEPGCQGCLPSQTLEDGPSDMEVLSLQEGNAFSETVTLMLPVSLKSRVHSCRDACWI